MNAATKSANTLANPQEVTSFPPIPMLDLTRQYQGLKPLLDTAVLDVMASGCFILGPQVHAFEQEAAAFCQTKFSVGVASGTDALYLALRALDIGQNDEVITTAFSYIATSEAIAQTGAKPVFADIAPDGSFNIDLSHIETLITPNTKAILPVHLFGQPVAMAPLMALANRHGLPVIEDCAQAMGAMSLNEAGIMQPVGSFGAMGCFSFFPTKNLGAFGDGGLITTQHEDLNERLKMLRAHGSRKRYYHEEPGLNSRLDELQAAILRVKLPHLLSWNNARREVASRYSALFEAQNPSVICPHELNETYHVFHQYTILLPEGTRDTVMNALSAKQIACSIYYPVPLHLQATHAMLGYQPGSLPLVETAAQRVLSLPIFPEISPQEQTRVVDTILSVL
ncbi:MAG: DegT/DnrJ/EryC1/StrS family aminotransferase [Vampirovibrionales bacterium]|nr:DegT/DnrJ/EryC1/StrS family aminotransferase [Vampirovibrionales bacterium]